MKNLGENAVEEKRKPNQLPDDKEQSKRFEETARELGVDESGESFERAIGVIVPPVSYPRTEKDS
jgi:hypothetical protein